MRPVILASAWLAALVTLAVGQPRLTFAVALLAAVLPLLLLRDRRGLFLGCAALGVVGLAVLRWQSATAPPSPESIAWWTDGERHALTGRVTAPPELHGATQRVRLAVDSVESGGDPVVASGAVLARVPAGQPLRVGDHLRLDGKLTEPPALDGFDYAAYLARSDVYGVMEYPRLRLLRHDSPGGLAGLLERGRQRAHEALLKTLPAEQAALAEGTLIGRRAEIPRDVNDAFNRAGVSHLIVISGFNIALLGGVVMSATGWLVGRRRSGMLALLAIALFSVFVGLTPSVLRAALMGSLAVLALLSGRPYGAGTALLFAATALTVQEPRILNDISFQLSFAATAGLLILARWPIEWGRRVLATEDAPDGPTLRSLALAVWETLAITLAATAATLPLMLLDFGRLSLVSPLANVILVPLFTPVMVLGSLGLALAVAAPPLAGFALAPLGALLELTLRLVRFCAALPFASVQIHGFQTWHAALIYGTIAVAALGRWPGLRPTNLEKERHAPRPLLARPLPVLSLAPAALLFLLAGLNLSRPPSGSNEARADLFNLSGAPVALLTLPGGARVLVDTGAGPLEARALLDRSAAGASRHLAALVLTAESASSTGGLAAVLDRYDVDLLLAPPPSGQMEAPWLAEARARGVPARPLTDGLVIAGGRAALTVQPPSRAAGHWRVTLAFGGRRVALDDPAAEAGSVRAGRRLTAYARLDGALLRAVVAPGEAASFALHERGVRLTPPRARTPELFPCPPGCDMRTLLDQQ